MSVPLEGATLDFIAVVSLILGAILMTTMRAALSAFGEVRLLAAEERGGRDGTVARRMLAMGSAVDRRLAIAPLILTMVALVLAHHRAAQFATLTSYLVLTGVVLVGLSMAVGLAAVARARAVSWALPMARWLWPLLLVVAPFSWPFEGLAKALGRRFAAPSERSGEYAVREVEHMIEQQEESGSISEDFAELLLSVLEFKDTVAREVMVPRTRMKAIEIGTSVNDILDLILTEGHSRYPVYRERVDQIEGILYAKDLFRILRDRLPNSAESPVDWQHAVRRPVFFVAETHKIGALLREMQARRFHLAVVADEFGGTSGIVTLEDILEEIVGEIRDEHDSEEPTAELIGDGRWWVDGGVSVHDLSGIVEAELTPPGDVDSVGGFVVDLMGRVPLDGESVRAQGFEFIVRAADERHVTRVEVVRCASDPGSVGAAAE